MAGSSENKTKSTYARQNTMANEIERDARWENEKKPNYPNTKTYNLVVDDVPYIVQASPFSFNDELRFYITINGGNEHVLTWDSEIQRLRAIDDLAGELADAVEEEISRKLQGEIA